MASDVWIRRCTLTIGRHGGWSWGDGPRPYVAAALAGVEAAVQAAIAEAGIPAGGGATLEAVRLDLTSDGTPTEASRAALVERLRAAAVVWPAGAPQPAASMAADELGASGPGGKAPGDPSPVDLAAGARDDGAPSIDDAAPGRRPDATGDGSPRARDGGGGATGGASSSGAGAPQEDHDGATLPDPGAGDVAPEHVAAALARTLGRWSRTGHAARFVQDWPQELALAWIGAIAEAARSVAGDDAATAALTAEAVDRIAGAVLGDDDAGAARIPSAPAAQRLLVLLAALASTLGDRLPDGATQALARRRVMGRDAGPRAATLPSAAAADAPEQAIARIAPSGEPGPRPARRVGLVVPALPFLVLAQLSRIGYVDAIVAAAATAGLPAGAIAAAAVGKSLPAPRGDDDRDPVDLAAMALAGGASEDELPATLALIADCAPRLLAPLASALQSAYAQGRSANDELLVWRGAEGILCGEPEGLLPVAWVQTDAELDAVLASLGRPPARRDDDGELGDVARALHDRRTLPGAPALEQHFGAAAGTALGMIALNLWGSSEPATPLLALERFADFEALARPADDGLIVSIPRGQRWLDLQRVGMLELFPIPWLPRGLLEIGTW